MAKFVILCVSVEGFIEFPEYLGVCNTLEEAKTFTKSADAASEGNFYFQICEIDNNIPVRKWYLEPMPDRRGNSTDDFAEDDIETLPSKWGLPDWWK